MSSSTEVTTAATEADARVKAAIESAVADPSDLSAYAAITDRGERARVRSAVAARVTATIAKVDPTDPVAGSAAIVEFKRLSAVSEAMSAAKSAPKSTPVDPKVAIANRIATLRLAADLLETGFVAPDGLDPVDVSDWRDLATGVDVVTVRNLTDRSVTRAPKSHDVAAGITSAMANVPVGEFRSVAWVANTWRDEHNGPDAAGGRISARVYAPNGCTVPGIAPATDEKGRKGLVRTA